MLARLGFSERLQQVVRTACRESARQRYASVEEFCAALKAALSPATHDAGSSPWLQLVAESGPLSGGSLLLPLDRQDDSRASQVSHSAGTPAPARELRAHAVVDCQVDRETRVEDRRLSLVSVARTGQLDLGGSDERLPSRARFRLTFLPSRGPLPRLNVKGLNCFVARAGGRATAAVDIEGDAELELYSPERKKLEGLRCTMGELRSGQHVYQLGNLSFALTGAEAGAVLIEASAGGELVLVHRASSSFIGGRP
jgi:hypothetical protein